MDEHDVSQKIDFAVSHNSESLGWAQRLLLSLENEGLIGWIDARAFYSPLVAAEGQIQRAFRKARFIVVAVGDDYRDSAWCREEYLFGLRSERDLSIVRVLVALESPEASALIPGELASCPTFDASSDVEIRRLGELIASGGTTSSQLSRWCRDRRDDASLLDRLAKQERLKLLGDHIEYLLKNFSAGTTDTRDHESAVRLGLTATPVPGEPSHFSPALVIEMCWRWVLAIIGEPTIRRYLADEMAIEETASLHIPDLHVLLERILPLFGDYLAVALQRQREPNPESSELALLTIVDCVICAFVAILHKAGQCDEHLLSGVRELLQSAASYGDDQCRELAAYLSEGLPAIGLPDASTERSVDIALILDR